MVAIISGNSHSQAPWSQNPNLNKHTQTSHSVHSGSRLTREMSNARNASVMDVEICKDNVEASLPSSPRGGLNMPHDESMISISSLGINRVAESRAIRLEDVVVGLSVNEKGLNNVNNGAGLYLAKFIDSGASKPSSTPLNDCTNWVTIITPIIPSISIKKWKKRPSRTRKTPRHLSKPKSLVQSSLGLCG